mgnify:CR=1 FL=1
MKKSELVDYISEKAQFTKKDSLIALDAVVGGIVKCLEEGGTIAIPNFGSFKAVQVDDRVGRNPQTGDPLTIPAHLAPKFKFSNNLKERIKAAGKPVVALVGN